MIRLDVEQRKLINRFARKAHQNASEFIRGAIMEKIQNMKADSKRDA
jgi:uncharacterized protein (DUF1778 family)